MRLSKFFLTLTAGIMLVPGLVLAETGESGNNASPSPKVSRSPEAVHSPKVDRPKVEAAAFCSKFTDATSQVSGDTATKFNQLQANFGQRGDKINSQFRELGKKIQDNRSDWDKKRDENFTKLEAKATTSEQKAAAATFEAAVKAAVARRRAAVDAAEPVWHR